MSKEIFISGFSIIRNGVDFDFPFEESFLSVLPLVDEFVVTVGKGTDDTLKKIQTLAEKHPKIKIFESEWDEALRTGGKILAQQTNLSMQNCQGKWGIYIQADEVLHEADYAAIRSAIQEADQKQEVDGLLFNYLHFYGDFHIVNNNPSSYRHEIRAVRLENKKIYSYGDAQGFRIQDGTDKGNKLKVIHANARIFHYGWVRPPKKMQSKTEFMDSLYHSEKNATGDNYKYKRIIGLERFTQTHPELMRERIEKKDWEIDLLNAPLVFRLDDIRKLFYIWIEKLTGWRPFEYKNYLRIK